MRNDEGTVVDLKTGERIGKTASMEALFIEAVKHALTKEPCFVVVSPNGGDEFAARIRELCPVVEDGELDDCALIIAGDPAEWEALKAGG